MVESGSTTRWRITYRNGRATRGKQRLRSDNSVHIRRDWMIPVRGRKPVGKKTFGNSSIRLTIHLRFHVTLLRSYLSRVCDFVTAILGLPCSIMQSPWRSRIPHTRTSQHCCVSESCGRSAFQTRNGSADITGNSMSTDCRYWERGGGASTLRVPLHESEGLCFGKETGTAGNCCRLK